MRLRIGIELIKRTMACAAFAACANTVYAGIVETNPLCIAAIAEGYAVINKGIKGQTHNQEEIAILQNSIAAEYTMMKKWEQKYNSRCQDTPVPLANQEGHRSESGRCLCHLLDEQPVSGNSS